MTIAAQSSYVPGAGKLLLYLPGWEVGRRPLRAEDLRKDKEMNRIEHLTWCKKRALEYVETGDLNQAYASMASDLGKHMETADHPGIQLGMMLLMSGRLGTSAEMRKFIEGFN